MSDEKLETELQTREPVTETVTEVAQSETQTSEVESSARSDERPDERPKERGGRGGKGRGRRMREREPREFEQTILDLARVTRVTKGGKRMRFRVALVIGDKKGRVGFGVAKGADVQMSIQKAYHQAKKNVRNLELVNGTFPHRVAASFRSADVLLMPAPSGTGLKAGGAVRTILELGGVSDAVGKIIRGQNKLNVAKAVFTALERMEIPEGVITDKEQRAHARKQQRERAAKKIAKKTEENA
ncbi:MAG: 30S ribosomal protein S5 [Patescibacteria group bacterium]